MKCVVDVNVVFSSLLTTGNSLNIFILNEIFTKFEFIAPEFLLIELKKHKEEIKTRSKLSEEDIEYFMNFILKQIAIVPDSEFNSYLEGAKIILKEHLKDLPYLALANKFNCNIFSGDKILKGLCPQKVYSPAEMIKLFYSSD